jgi:hypothetical protein
MGEAWEEGGVGTCCGKDEGEGLEEEGQEVRDKEWVVRGRG